MQYTQRVYTANEAEQLAKQVGDIDSSPKHLKREILSLKQRITELENRFPRDDGK